MFRFCNVFVGAIVVLSALTSADAALFQNIRIGDLDGFGINPTGLVNTSGAPADTNGNGIIEQTEFLPDWNTNGVMATGQGDDFDARVAAEVSDSLLGGTGYTDTGSIGSKWTDISLSTSFHTTFPGANFPDPAGPAAPNEPLFAFRFDVNKADIVEGSTIFFNLIFGDYDVSPANVRLTTNNGSGGPSGSPTTIPLTLQPGNEDGLVQSAYLTLDFADIFSDSGGAAWNGYLDVKFVAPNEPYTAFDFAELSLDQIPPDPHSTIPEPASLIVWSVLGAGCAGGALAGRRKRRAPWSDETRQNIRNIIDRGRISTH